MSTPRHHKSGGLAALLLALLAAVAAVAFAAGLDGAASAPASTPRGANSPQVAPSLPPQTYPGTLVITNVSEPDHNYNIYRVRSDGTRLARLTRGRGNEEHAYWSPDGTRIVYGNRSGIWVMNADGSGKVRMAESGMNPFWSPDGKQILYDGGGTWVMNADGSGKRCVVGFSGGPHGIIEEPYPPRYATWAANGMIVFVRVGDPVAGGGRYPGGDLFAVNLDGSGFVRLTEDAGMILPSVSPDGSTIAAYVPKKDRIIVVPWQGDGAQVTLLARASQYFRNRGMPTAAWTSDGRKLVLGSSNFGETGGSRLYIVKANGSGLVRIPHVRHALCPAWRPQ